MKDDKDKLTIGFFLNFVVSVSLLVTSFLLFIGAFFYDVSFKDFILSISIGIFLIFISMYVIVLAYESRRLGM